MLSAEDQPDQELFPWADVTGWNTYLKYLPVDWPQIAALPGVDYHKGENNSLVVEHCLTGLIVRVKFVYEEDTDLGGVLRISISGLARCVALKAWVSCPTKVALF